LIVPRPTIRLEKSAAGLEEPVVKFLVNQQNQTFFCDLNALPTGKF
jgi:hypothetical protein